MQKLFLSALVLGFVLWLNEGSFAQSEIVRPAATELFNTGVDNSGTPLAANLPDPHWKVLQVSQPDHPVGDAVLLENSASYRLGAYPPPNELSWWIAPGQNRGGTPPGFAPDTYYTTFLLDSVDPGTFKLTGKLWITGTLVEIGVNGIVRNPSFYFKGTSPYTFTLTQDFKPGLNTIQYFHLGDAALRVEFESTGVKLASGLPSILEQPQDQIAQEGGTATLSTVAVGRSPLLYQWFVDGSEIPGATNRTLHLNAQGTASHRTNAFVVVRNDSGSITSRVAAMTVSTADRPPVPGDFRYPLFVGATLSNSFAALLAAANDANHDPIRLVSIDSSSTRAKPGITNVVLDDDSFLFTPLNSFWGEDQIGYGLTDGRDNVAGVIRVQVFSQPQPQTVRVGDTATFDIKSSGSLDGFTFQWRRNGTNIAGATHLQFILPDAALSMTGNFDVVVKNSSGTEATSPVAQLVVRPRLEEGASVLLPDCSFETLEKAVQDGGNYRLPCNGPISFARQIVVRTNVTLSGEAMTTFSGGKLHRLFVVEENASLRLNNLTLKDGFATGGANTNGYPLNPGTNIYGGAIWNRGGTLILSNCTFNGNAVVGGNSGPGVQLLGQRASKGGIAFGGAIMTSNGIVQVIGCKFLSNTARGGDEGPQEFLFPPAGGGDGLGGAIYQYGGQLEIVNSAFTSNAATPGKSVPSRYTVLRTAKGGALAVEHTSGVTIDSTQFEINSASEALSEGGALYLGANSDVTITHSTFDSNFANAGLERWQAIGNASARGGAIFLTNGTAQIDGCFLLGNSALGGQTDTQPYSYGAVPSQGGALYASGTVTVRNSTFWKNNSVGAIGLVGLGLSKFADGFGGAIHNHEDLLLINCTLVSNKVSTASIPVTHETSPQPEATGYGGALANVGRATIIHSTFSQNSATSFHGEQGVSAEPGGSIRNFGNLALARSILSMSASNNFAGAITDGGENISSDSSPPFTLPSSRNSTDAKLGPLKYNRGSTPTMGLLEGSPAIDAATPSVDYQVDQRGQPRPFGKASDIGAYEVTDLIAENYLELIASGDNPLINFFSTPGAAYQILTSTNLRTWQILSAKQIDELGRGSVILSPTSTNTRGYFKAQATP